MIALNDNYTQTYSRLIYRIVRKELFSISSFARNAGTQFRASTKNFNTSLASHVRDEIVLVMCAASPRRADMSVLAIGHGSGCAIRATVSSRLLVFRVVTPSAFDER